VAADVHRHGGMERAQAEVIDHLLARGWQVQVIARSCEIDRHPGLTFRRVWAPRRPFVLAYPLFVLIASVMLKVFRKGRVCVLGANALARADVVVVQFCHAAFQALGPVPRRSRDTLLGRASDAAGRFLTLTMERWAFKPDRAGRYIAVSANIASELGRHYAVPPEAITVVPNGVDAHEFRADPETRARVRSELDIEENELLALFVGGDWSRKGLRVAIEAVSLSRKWTLLVVGAGDSTGYQGLAKRLGARAIFRPSTRVVQDYFAAADAFVLPTKYEGFALVTLEASAAGLPILTTPASGARSLIELAGAALLDESPEAFANDLERLSDASVRQAAATRSAEAATHFGWTEIGAAYEAALS
jgi:glycosyltransferase involved in cell wall biosynthesis